MTTPKLGANTCQCATCGQCFVGTGAFDRHRNSDHKTCTAPEERGMEKRADGAWRVPLTAAKQAQLDRFRDAR